MSAANRHLAIEDELDTLCVFDHFWQDQSDINAIDTVTDTGTVVMGDAAGGTVVLTPSDGTVADNDEVYLATPNENFLFATGKNLYGRCRLKFAETTAGVYNVGFGFMNAVGANALIDDGGGPKVSGSTLAIAKIDNTSVWRCYSANNSVSTVTVSNRPAVANTWYDLQVFGTDNGDGTWVCTFKVDGEYLRDANNNVIRHTVTIASATEMNGWVGAKLGAITNNDVTTVDFWLFKQKAF